MSKAGASNIDFSVAKLFYLFVILGFLAWCLGNYVQAFWRYKQLWSGAPQLNPLSDILHNPIVVLECKVEGSQLVVRLLRTYSEPEAEDLQVVVELQFLGGKIAKMEIMRRVVLGSILSLEFPLSFSVELLLSYKVEVYLSGKLVTVKQGG